MSNVQCIIWLTIAIIICFCYCSVRGYIWSLSYVLISFKTKDFSFLPWWKRSEQTLLFLRNNIDFFIETQVLYILFYCCYLFIYYVVIDFILLIKWILQNFYEFQRRETLATNQIVENNKKAGEGSLEENPEVDSVFITSMDSPECLQILFICL